LTTDKKTNDLDISSGLEFVYSLLKELRLEVEPLVALS